MFSFMASPAIALSPAKQNTSKVPASGQQSAARRTGKGFWSRLLEAMVESRRRRAEIELRHYRRLRQETEV